MKRFITILIILFVTASTNILSQSNIKKTKANPEDPLFEIKDEFGETIFSVTGEGVRFYVKDLDAKGVSGGFAVGRYGTAKGVAQNYMHLTDNNYFIGHKAGQSMSSGLYNTFYGYEAGTNSTTGSQNVFVGYKSGHSNSTGEGNIYLGNSAGFSNMSSGKNIAIGDSASFLQNGGWGNTVVGYRAGYEGSFYNNNTYIGGGAGKFNPNSNNTFIGNAAGGSGSCTGEHNVFVGIVSGCYNQGNENTFIGNSSGFNSTGSGNVLIGYKAGYNNNESNRLYIDNSNTIYPLIFGDFSTPEVVINGNSGDNTNNMKFYVYGQAGGNTAWWNDSDKKLKKNITTIPNALDKVMQLRGVNFEWKERRENIEGTQMGFIAQEAEIVIPEVVNNTKGNYAMQYAPITALLVESVKEQQNIINNLESRLKKLEEDNIELKKLIKEISDLRNLIENN